MYVTAKLDYALRALAELASRAAGEAVPATVIADVERLPLPYIRAILAELQHNGIVEIHRGRRAGYRLGRPAAAISVGDVVVALKLRPVEVHDGGAFPDDGVGLRMNAVWRELDRTTATFLESITLADLASPRPDASDDLRPDDATTRLRLEGAAAMYPSI